MPNLPTDSFRPLTIPGRFVDDPIEPPLARIAATTAAQLADDLGRDGINPDRSSCPSLLRQLRLASNLEIDTMICCAIDGDPLLPVNATVAIESTEDVAAALVLLATLLQPKRVLLVAEPEVLVRCKKPHKSKLPPGLFRPVLLRADYPLTDARLLLETVLRRKIAPHGLPTDARAVVLDAAAAATIGRWSRTGYSDGTILLAVRDHVAADVHLLRVPRGSTVGEVLAALNIPTAGVLVRTGDFLRDLFVSLDQVVDNGEPCLHVTAPQKPEPSEPCIRCAWCVEACPARIQPAGLLEAAQRDDLYLAGRFGLHNCIECGICSYVCPSRLPLLPAIRKLLTQADTVHA